MTDQLSEVIGMTIKHANGQQFEIVNAWVGSNDRPYIRADYDGHNKERYLLRDLRDRLKSGEWEVVGE